MTSTTGVAIPDDLLEWADENYLRLGYSSRSELIRDSIRQLRENTDEHRELKI